MINIKFFLLCPIPEDQNPINEYIGLKENPLTNWTTLSKKYYERQVFSFFLGIFILISFFNFSHLEFFDEWLFENLFWACFSFMNFGFLLIIAFVSYINKSCNFLNLNLIVASVYNKFIIGIEFETDLQK
jgi:hypothetical protein